MKKEETKVKKLVSLRQDLLEKVKQEAQEEFRNVSEQFEYILAQHYKRKEENK